MTSGDLNKEMRDHVWRYFELHAGQRMTIFNFFVVLSSFVATGAGLAAVQSARSIQLAGSILGLLLVAISLVFGKLDERVSHLIKRAERALAELEGTHFPEAVGHLFRTEPLETKANTTTKGILFRGWTYGSSFRALFWTTGIVGLCEALLCLSRSQGWLQ
jgi:hypothetical protein